MYYVYVLGSRDKKQYYKGITNDLERRLFEHNKGRSRSSRNLLPLRLAHVEIVSSLGEARKLEKFFKSGYGREIIKEISADD